ncbi:MAG TPA: T9SS type A sorting domain-containing protein [Bacteroidetes bacterium]|nr:T9SS type A sorting domain-containing protein [Bacteroidota bacterium]
MKQLYIHLLLSLFASASAMAQIVNISFTVNMSQETVDSAGVRMAGSFNGWADTLMADNGDGTWSLTLQLTPDDAIEYKFKNGPDGWENFDGPCNMASFGNRTYTVPADDETVPTVCFNSCFNCGIQGVTLTVDMSEETVDTAGVFIAGEHNGWTDGPMTDNGDGTWSTTIGVATGDTTQYKFKNGPDGWETFDGSCLFSGSGSNRWLVGPAADSTTATVCFNSCDACGGGPVNVTFTVDMQNETVDSAGVRMAGSFNGWSDTLMSDNGDGTWSITLQLAGGSLTEYKFKNGPDGWENFGGPCLIGDTGSNRFINAPESDVTLPTVCFNSCFGCNQIGVTLTVDMQFETVDPAGVFLAGEHNGWTDGPMTNNGNGTWTGYFGAMPGDTIEYKFKNGPNGWENFDGDCLISGAGSNRYTPIPMMQDTVIDVVCFNMCEACVVLDTVDVTFRVDMTEQTVAPEGVFLAGSFNNFSDAPMVNMGDSIWALTIQLAPGDTVTYKFKNGPDGWESISDMSCTDGSFSNNRLLIAPPLHTTLDAVCFGKCSVCFDPYSVTSASVVNSCKNPDGTVTIMFDESLNCDVVVGELAGMAQIGFHSGANQWASVVAWDDPNAVTATNDGNDVFSLTIDPAAYYGLPADEITSIWMVFNQGPADPANPWDSEGKDQDLDENGSCDDLRLFVDQMPACSFDPTTTSSPALKNAGSCYDPNTGMVKIRFDEAMNCPNAPGDLASMAEIGFHSGANTWSNVVAWDDAGAVFANNDGNDVFETIIDPISYYGLGSFAELDNIYMVFNQGATMPNDPWASEGKDFDVDGNCVDMRFILSDLPTCEITTTIDRELENSLVAIPNPFTDKTTVVFSNPDNDTFEVSLLDVTGKTIRTFARINGTNFEIDGSDLSRGMYFLNFRNMDGKLATLKLVVK